MLQEEADMPDITLWQKYFKGEVRGVEKNPA